MLLQFFKHANGKFILLIFLFVLILRVGLSLFLGLDLLLVLPAYIIHCISAVFLNRIFTKNLITKKYSILPAFIFLLLTTSQHFISFNSIVTPFLLFCLALVSLSNIYPAEKVDKRLFNSGLLLSTTLIFNPAVVFITTPLIFIFQVLYNTNQFKRILVSLTALLTPIFIYYSFSFIVFNDIGFISTLSKAYTIEIKYLTQLIPALAFPIVLSILSLLDLQSNFQHKKILSRKFILLNIVLGITHLLLIAFTTVPISSGIFILLPVTLLLSNYFEHIGNKWIHNILFMLLILVSCITPFFGG